MRRRSNGSIQPSAFPSPQNLGYVKDSSIYRGMVIAVNYVGPDNLTLNASNARVLYDCVLLGGQKSGVILTNCRLSTSLGGSDNYHEIILKPSTKELNVIPLPDHDGDIVLIQFIQGDQSFPMIVGMDQGIDTSGEVGATIEDGVREKRQFNGVSTETSKTGEHTFKRQSGNEVEGRFQPNEGDPEYLLEYQDQEKVTETFKSGLVVEKDGGSDKVTVTTSGGVVAEIDGQSNKVTLTAGATVVEIDGATGMIKLSGAFVDLGAVVSDLVLLATQVITAHNSHIHLHTSIPGTTPTTAPVAPMPPTVFSKTVKVQP